MTVEPWGRLLIAGGTDFATLGRKDKQGKPISNEERPDLPAAHIMRAVANIKFKKVITSHSGCHAVAISLDNKAYLLGRNEHHQLSHPLPPYLTVPHFTSDGVTHSPTPCAPQPFPLHSLPDANAPKELKDQGIVDAAIGRGHTILVTETGEAWTAGWNVLGQCGQPDEEHIGTFKRVRGDLDDEKVVAASAGNSFSMFLCESGKVYAVGTGEKGVLGNGKTGEHIATSKTFYIEQHEPLLVRGVIADKKIVQISSGQLHTVALDDEGYVYAWGFGGLGRLGTGVQVDALSPTLVPQFSGTNPLTRCAKIAAGPANTLFIDNQGLLSLCGKWKLTGDGSSGQPWMTPKYVQDLMGYKWDLISAGGSTLFGYSRGEKDGDFTVAWGQNCTYGELAFGPGALKSATKPQRVELLEGIEFLDIAAGQNTTFFIARPPPLPLAEGQPEVSPSPAPEAPAAASTAAEPVGGVDLSGFGYSFGAAAEAAAGDKKDVAKKPTIKKRGRSTTKEEEWNELGRYPAVLDAVDACKICGKEEGPEEALECEMCENAFHGACCNPPVYGVPDGEWFCDECSTRDGPVNPEAPVTEVSKKRKAEDEGAVANKKK